MDSNKIKQTSRLINAHKIAGIISPLVEAVEINKRSGAIGGISVDSLFEHVIEIGQEIYKEILGISDKVVDNGEVPDKIFLILAKSLRNSVVLYGSASLHLMKDEILGVFSKNLSFLQHYQNNTEKVIDGNVFDYEIDSEGDVDYIATSVAQMFMPIWLFHSNLYASGKINVDQMVELNSKVSTYMTGVLLSLHKRMLDAEGEMAPKFKNSSLFVCAEISSNLLYDYQSKIINTKKALVLYIESPEKLLSKLVPSIYASMHAMNEISNKILNNKQR